ncbi:MAG: hypothetical protein QM784_13225 [Polyangiaceae bacterium]
MWLTRPRRYSLGVLLWELLANRPVFSRKDVQRATSSVISQPIPQLDRVERLGLPVPKELVVLVARAIDRDPRRRTPSLVAFADAIDELPAHLLASTDQVGNCIRRLAGPFVAESYQSSGWKIRAKGEDSSLEVASEASPSDDNHDWEPETLAARTLLTSDVTELTKLSEPNPLAAPQSEVYAIETPPQIAPSRRRVWVPVLLTLLVVAAVLGLLHQLGIVRATISIDRSSGRGAMSLGVEPRKDGDRLPSSVAPVTASDPVTTAATTAATASASLPQEPSANVMDLDGASPTDANTSTGKAPPQRGNVSARARHRVSRGTGTDKPAAEAPTDDHWGI